MIGSLLALVAALALVARADDKVRAQFAANLAYASPYANVPHLAIDVGPLAKRHAALLAKRAPAPNSVKFLHGVASGDPLPNRVVLWTKITPSDPKAPAPTVAYQVATSDAFDKVVRSGSVQTSADVDYTVKVDVDGLAPATAYYYRFVVDGTASPTGRTKTLPPAGSKLNQVRLAAVSCSNMPHGYFSAYRALGERNDVDVLLHLGDYIYEYDINGFPTFGSWDTKDKKVPADRVPAPNKAATTLDDYRTRHAQYKTDPDLQFAHQNMPWILIWDDHEFANNASPTDAPDHDPAKMGPWDNRKFAAARAYSEYIPMRPPTAVGPTYKIYRQFVIGDLVNLLMLDTRMEGRTSVYHSSANSRQLMGPEQEAWMLGNLENSKQLWNVLGNQVWLSELPRDFMGWEMSYFADSWIGYPRTRDALLNTIVSKNIKNVVSLAGDQHATIASDVALNIKNYDPDTGKGSIMVEMGTPSVTSMGGGAESKTLSKLAAWTLRRFNRGAKFSDWYRHGFVLATFTRAKLTTEFWYIPDIKKRAEAKAYLGVVAEVQEGANRVTNLKLLDDVSKEHAKDSANAALSVSNSNSNKTT